MGLNGDLPTAAAVRVGSDAQLAEEVAAAGAELGAAVDWERRVRGLLRLEGLVLGGAAAERGAAFAAALLPLRAALAGEMAERRSAVSRQACHAAGALADALGPLLEPLAAALLAAAFRAQAMGIHVVAEAADAAARALVRGCPSGRLLAPLATAAAARASAPRLRAAAAAYLAIALGEWEQAGALCEGRDAEVSAAVVAAAGDAAADVRAAGRAAWAAYCHARPDAARALLRGLPEKERALRERLAAAAAEEVGPDFLSAAAAARPPSRGASRTDSPQRLAPAGAASPPRAPSLGAARPGSATGALRVSLAATSLSPRPASGGAGASPPRAPATARRLPGGGATRVAVAAAPAPRRPASPEAPRAPRTAVRVPSCAERASPRGAARAPLLPLGDHLAELGRPGAAWAARVAAFNGIEAALEAPGGGAAATAAAEMLGEPLAAGCADPHTGVAAAALAAAAAALSAPEAAAALAAAGALERLAPAIFGRVGDGPERVRALAAAAADAVLTAPHEAAAAGLARALLHPAPRVKVAVLERYAAAAPGWGAGGAGASGAGARALAAGAVAAAADRRPEVRAAALAAAAAAYRADPYAIAAAVGALPPSPQGAVSRALARCLDEARLAADVAVARAGGGASPRAVAAASPGVRRALALSDPPAAAAAALGSPPRRSWSAAGSPAAKGASPLTIAVDATTARRAAPGLFAADADAPGAPPPTAAALDAALAGLAGAPAAEPLRALAALAQRLPLEKWEARVGDVVAAAAGALEAPGAPADAQRAALQALNAVLSAVPAPLFAPAAPAAVGVLLRAAGACAGDELAAWASIVLGGVLATLPPAARLRLLAGHLPLPGARQPFDGLAAGALLAALAQLAPALAAAADALALEPALPALLPPLAGCFGSANAEVRKRAVECLVAAWRGAGADAARPHLSALSPPQVKLLEIYLKKANAAAPAGAAAPPSPAVEAA
jgi:CLIP-associating protein 1/2